MMFDFERKDRIHHARKEYVRLRNEQMKKLDLAATQLASGEPQAIQLAHRLQKEAISQYTEALGRLARFLRSVGIEPSQLA